jgi:hypothetical protein
MTLIRMKALTGKVRQLGASQNGQVTTDSVLYRRTKYAEHARYVYPSSMRVSIRDPDEITKS